ncbi:MAG: hypothetical protein ACOVP2_02420 [Armatimonadaceae bacterium]
MNTPDDEKQQTPESYPEPDSGQPQWSDTPPPKPRTGFLKFLPAIGLLLLKGKSIIGALKFLWLAKSGLSILLFVGLEAYLFGWPAAVIITLIILSMSLGRFIAYKCQRRRIKPLTLIPFIGGGLTAADAGETAAHDAWVGLSGPMASGLLSLSCLGLYIGTGSRIWPVMALLGLSITLFQLAPAPFLSGGTVAMATFPKLLLPGIILLVVVAPTSPIVWILGLMSLMPAIHLWRNPLPDLPYFSGVSIRTKIIIGATWILMGVIIAAAYRITANELDFLRSSGM